MTSTTDSVREALDFIPGVFGSVAQRFTAAGMDPLDGSLRALMDKVSPETRTFSNAVEAGDVKVRNTLTVASNGDFVWTLDASDSGTFFGDEFTVAVALNRPAPDGTTFGLSRQETLDADESGQWTMVGNSQWLIDHWDLTAPPTGLYAHLKASWDVEALDILTIVGVGVVVFALVMIGGGYCKWETDPQGNQVCVKRW